MPQNLTLRQRWLALYVLCFGVLMIVLDTTVVTVALPSIQASLGFSETTLVWVLNAYMLTFGGFLLLGGRLGDLYGNRRWFLGGLVVFTVASLACGVAQTQWLLVVARAVQGVGGAVVTAVALALIMNLFTDPDERAKAMGVYGFICAAGGSLGEILGGVLTELMSWEWVFLINLPIGIAVYAFCLKLLPEDAQPEQRQRLDIAGAVLVTSGLMAAVYAVIGGNAAGWASTQTITLLAIAAALLLAFFVVEARVRDPLMPLHLLRLRNLATANIVGILWSAGMFAWFVITALYLQRVLGYSPLQVGLSFMPADFFMAVFSLGLSAKLVIRFGIRTPLWVGLAIAGGGLLLISQAPLSGSYVAHILPGMLLLAAMSDVDESQSGLASGIANTAFMMGGALGLAVLASLADAATSELLASGSDERDALKSGYQLAFEIGAAMTLLGAAIGGVFVRPRPQAPDAAMPIAH
ncbi:DHA2 family efflux MFS transporter permease subunit [Hydrocarboniphaga sp.]|uniref:DHA2 family efflux MFS transporter permease subunit n=1 Tax=Hydrocarboniphaga sp. TaxID=2033016 RepID=UPI002AB9600C|nr:DHA2 family efflux MFS transporter permease subunit [Hydrocarboniphaga sp.]MDZ4077067.1 DHA2 family efflux MFS transporter permease subunit [Hydrocarboniphaga sp.]